MALAELSDKAPTNALLIAGNVAAMREALRQSGPVSIDSICSIHDVLMAETSEWEDCETSRYGSVARPTARMERRSCPLTQVAFQTTSTT